MEPKNNQVDEFFAKLPTEDKEQVDIFDEKKPADIVPEKKVDNDDPEKVPESIKDRRHRRLEQRLQEEREANIALNERVKVLSEMDRFTQEVGDAVIPDIAKMFDSSDVGKENALRLSKVIVDTQKRAKEEAIREIEEKQAQVIEEQKSYEALIDSELEFLEDTHNIDLTSDSPKARKARREFLELVQELSPKDENGDITGYADFESTFNVYQKTRTEDKPDNTRREEIANRSMKRSGPGSDVPVKRTSGFSGWKTDIERGII
jgi:hypothetical protein